MEAKLVILEGVKGSALTKRYTLNTPGWTKTALTTRGGGTGRFIRGQNNGWRPGFNTDRQLAAKPLAVDVSITLTIQSSILPSGFPPSCRRLRPSNAPASLKPREAINTVQRLKNISTGGAHPALSMKTFWSLKCRSVTDPPYLRQRFHFRVTFSTHAFKSINQCQIFNVGGGHTFRQIEIESIVQYIK